MKITFSRFLSILTSSWHPFGRLWDHMTALFPPLFSSIFLRCSFMTFRLPRGTLWGPGRGAFDPPEGARGAPKRVRKSTLGRKADFAKSLFLLHEIVHFDTWRGALAAPESTRRGRRHETGREGPREEGLKDQRGPKETPKGPKSGNRRNKGDTPTIK